MPVKTADTFAGFRAIAPGSKTIDLTLVVLGVLTAVGAVLTLAVLAKGAGVANRGFEVASFLLVTAALGFGGMWLWLRNVRLLIGQGMVGYRTFFGRSRVWSSGEIDRIVSMAVIYRKSSQPPRGIYCFGPDGRRLLALNSGAWPADDLKDFLEATGRPLDFRDAPIAAKDARREFPQAFGWGSQHITLMTCLTLLAATGLAVAGYVVATKLLLN